jgi:fumarate reductase subunit D
LTRSYAGGIWRLFVGGATQLVILAAVTVPLLAAQMAVTVLATEGRSVQLADLADDWLRDAASFNLPWFSIEGYYRFDSGGHEGLCL